MADQKKSKPTGTLFEYIFITEALRRGLQPHIPVGDYLPHDVVVYDAAGICKKVQVKGTASGEIKGRGKNRRYRITNKVGSAHTLAAGSEYDVLAAYVAPWDYWYLIPISAVVSKAVWMYPWKKIEDSKGRYEKYRNDWDIFSEEDHAPL